MLAAKNIHSIFVPVRIQEKGNFVFEGELSPTLGQNLS